MSQDKDLKLYFWGGVDSVTGANFVLESLETGKKIMIDCGLTQGFNSKKKDPNYEPFLYDPKSIDILILTHAHADHIGRVPKLVKDGFSGKIYCTKPTSEIIPLMFEDSLNVIENEARQKNIDPLYKKNDVEKALTLIIPIEYHTEYDLSEELSLFLNDAGHILGSSIVNLTHKKSGKKITFTGDLGNSPTPLIRNVEMIRNTNYLIMESVYGDRNHEGKEERKEKLKEILNKIIERRGTLLIPVFSLEKTQVLLHEMNDLIESNQIPSVPVFFDSPLGIKLTEVYSKQFKNFNEKVQARILKGDDIFDFPKLEKTFSQKESWAIHRVSGPKIIIASSGMSVGGRILEHEKKYLPDPKNAILFIGYQSAGSLGREILEGKKEIKIDKDKIKIKAEIAIVNGYSSHMDSEHLIEFVENVSESGNLKKVFVVMGETKSATFLTQRLRDYLGVDAVHPEEGSNYFL